MKLTFSAFGFCDVKPVDGSMITLALKRSQWPKMRPSRPRPLVLSSSRNDLPNSACSCVLLFFSASVPVGSARTHLCMIVHILGVGERAAIDFDGRKRSESALWVTSPLHALPFMPLVRGLPFGTESMGRLPCHCPSLLATPLQTGSRVRSCGVHTRPWMNL